MATEPSTSKDVVLRGFDALNGRDRDAFLDLHTEEAVASVFGEEIRGVDAITRNQFGLFEAFSDLTYTPHVLLAEEGTVAARWTAAGTHDGELDGIEPTGRAVEFPVMGMFEVEGDRLTEVRLLVDQFDLLAQLGVVDPPGD